MTNEILIEQILQERAYHEQINALNNWHPRRTTRGEYAARTTWRWGCSIVAALLLINCGAGLAALTTGGPAPLPALAVVLLTGSAAALPLHYRNTAPNWYCSVVAELGSESQ